MIDKALIALVKERQQDAFKAMYEQCIGYVYVIVRRYVTNESDHQDVIQEIFARLFLSIHTYDDDKGNFKFWLRRLVINQCFEHQRKGKNTRFLVSLDALVEENVSYEQSLPVFTNEELKQYLQSMPDGYKQIFMLVVIDEYSHQEVSELLGITAETSRSQLFRAKKWLRKRINHLNAKISVANG